MIRSNTGLVAARLPLDPGLPIDPFALAGEGGILFHAGDRVRVGLGTALDLPLPHGLDDAADLAGATAALAAIPCHDRGPAIGGAVSGFGALPFDRAAPAGLVVPEVIYGRDGAEEWVTVVTTAASRLPSSPAGLRAWLTADQTAPGDEGGPGDAVPARVVPRSSDASFVAMVADALGAIAGGDLVKVVLARQVEVTMGDAIDVPGLLRRWHDLEPNCTVFSVPTPAGQFVGASPELLVERSGADVVSRPLAGTAERFVGDAGSLLPEALLESPKDAIEHRLVVEAIVEALRPLCADLEVPSQPTLVHLHNIIHLATSLRGTLAPGPDGVVPDALGLVGALHPTPAVGGVPTPVARAMIERLEPEPRGRYAGPVGYVDARGDGTWMLGIRAMTVEDRTARLTAGVGIVGASDPAVELVETNVKLTAVLDALAPGLQGAASGHQTVAR